ncbi:hypothetical protein L7F22_066208 [Adiantum nelumboides]|nr:hypothetical protein [Adiantum nelumboides]
MSALVDDILIFSSGALTDFYQFLHIFNARSRQRGRVLQAKQVQLFTTHIEKHKELQKLGQVTPGSYLETLFQMDSSTLLSMDDLIALCTEFLGAGADTTVGTLEWAMAHIVDNPSIQSKLYEQIHSVVGNQPVEEKDLPHLPYLHSIVKETLRLHPPGISLLPHSVSAPCKLGGYDIPTNAILLFQITCINKDPEMWQDPSTFKPERFSNTDVEITGSREIRIMPFGAGRRVCPGHGFASLNMELFVACLVQSFEWTSFPAGATVDLTEKRISTIRLKHSLRAFVKEREVIHGTQ